MGEVAAKGKLRSADLDDSFKKLGALYEQSTGRKRISSAFDEEKNSEGIKQFIGITAVEDMNKFRRFSIYKKFLRNSEVDSAAHGFLYWENAMNEELPLKALSQLETWYQQFVPEKNEALIG